MSQALVFASIVLGVAIAFELENLDRLLRSKTVRWHWAQPLFAGFVLLTIMSFWWNIASRSGDGPITLAEFLPVMWVLVILNLLASASLPRTIPEEGIDLGLYYQDSRRYLWGLYLLIFIPIGFNWIFLSSTRSTSLEDMLVSASGEFIGMAIVIFMFFARRWWMVALGFASLGIIVAAWLTRTL